MSAARVFELDDAGMEREAAKQRASRIASENEALQKIQSSSSDQSIAEIIAQEALSNAAAAEPKKETMSSIKKRNNTSSSREPQQARKTFGDYRDEWRVQASELLQKPPIDLKEITSDALLGVGYAARALYRFARYGEQVPSEEDNDETMALKLGDDGATYVPPIGATGASLSDYLNKWKNSNRFQATAGWYIREAHHDPLGADPCMMSVFLFAFASRMFYESFVDALILAVIITVFEFVFWVALRGVFPIVARELDHTESVVVTLFYNIVSFGAGIAIGSLALRTWPGLISVWEALEQKGCGSDGVFLLWAPCTDAQTFVTQLLLFIFILFACFRSLYVALTILIALLIPIGWIAQVPYRVGNNLTFTAASSVYFLIWMVRPIKGTYVYNMFVSISFYLLVFSLAALSVLV